MQCAYLCSFVDTCVILCMCGCVYLYMWAFVDVRFQWMCAFVCNHNLYEGSVTATTTPASATRPGEVGGGTREKRMLFPYIYVHSHAPKCCWKNIVFTNPLVREAGIVDERREKDALSMYFCNSGTILIWKISTCTICSGEAGSRTHRRGTREKDALSKVPTPFLAKIVEHHGLC